MVFSEILCELDKTNCIKMTQSSTQSQATAAARTTQTPTTTTITTPKFTVNVYGESIDELIEEVNDIKVWIILIAIIIMIIVVLKLIKMCKKVYEMHNEKIIKRHSRISPQI